MMLIDLDRPDSLAPAEVVTPRLAVSELTAWVASVPPLASDASAEAKSVIELLIDDTSEICAVSVSALAFSAAVLAENCASISEGTSVDRSMPEPVCNELNSACAAFLVAA